MKKSLFSVLFMLMLVLFLVGCGGKKPEPEDPGNNPEEPGTEEKVIKIGSAGPLSGSASIYGQSVKKGVELAIAEINAAGGVNVNGVAYQFELTNFINDEADPDKASAALATLVGQDVDVIVGAVTSGATEGLILQAMTEGIPVITPTGTADKLTVGEDGDEREDRYNVFRACFYDSYQGKYMAQYAKEQGYKKAYVLYNNSEDYSVGLKDAFVETAGELQLEVHTQGYEKEVKNFSSYWSTIISGGYDCVYVPDYYENVYNILKTGYAEGYQGVCLGGDGWDGVVQQIQAEDDVTFLEKCFYTNHYFGKSEAEAVKTFVTNFKAANANEEPASFAALGYDAVYIVKQAIEQAGSFEYEAVIEALATGTFTDLVTSSTDFSFDENGNPQKAATVITFKDGVEVEAK